MFIDILPQTICVGNIYVGGTGKTSFAIKLNEILKKGRIRIEEDAFCKFDTIESKEDIENLVDVLSKFKDINNRNPQVTCNFILTNPNFEKIKSLLKSKAIFDGRNVFSLEKMKEEGFYYESIGRTTVTN